MPVTPQSTDYITTTQNKLWTMLRASAFIKAKILAGNQITFLGGVNWPEKKNRNAGDFPELLLRVDSCRILNRNTMPTFCNTRGSTGDVVIEQEVVFKFMLTTDGVDENLPNDLLTEMIAVFMPDPRLGLSFVKTSGQLRAKPKETTQGTAGSGKRIVTDILFPVVFSLHRADLTS